MENQFLRELRKLSPAGKGEVFMYARWLLDMEKRERLAALRDNMLDDQVHSLHESGKSKKPLPVIQKWLSNWGFSI